MSLASSPETFQTWSIQVRDVDSGEILLEENPAMLLHTGAAAKLFLLIEIAALIQGGSVEESRPLLRRVSPDASEPSLWRHLREDTLSVHSAAVLTGCGNDPVAANALLDVAGLPAVRRRAEELAPLGSHLADYFRESRGEGVPETVSLGCATDLTALLVALHRGTCVSPEVSARVLDWIAPAADVSMAALAFDLNPFDREGTDLGLRCWNVTGSDRDVRADIGLVTGRRRTIAYGVICNDAALATDRECRREVYQRMWEIGDQVRAAVGA